MTTGSKTFDRTYVVQTPTGGAGVVGRKITKTWSGTDAITSTKPRASYPKVVRSAKEWKVFREALKAKKEAEKLARLRKRLLPPQKYSLTVYDVTTSYNQTKYVGETAWRYGTGPADLFPASLPAIPVEQEYKLLEKLRRKAYGTGFNPAVFTAEGREACGMIANGATRVRKAIGSLLRKDWRGLSRHLSIDPNHAKATVTSRKNISGQWLELSYGWQPLLSDVEDGAAFIGYNMNLQDYGGQKLVVRRSFSVPVETKKPGPNDFIWTERRTVFDIQYVIYNVRKSPVYQPSIATVASVAWERLPYSFVADWVVPIGDYIEAMRTAADLKGTIVKSVKRLTVYAEPRIGSNLIWGGWWSAHGPARKSQFNFDRTVQEELTPPHPLTGFDLTPTSVFRSWQRAANAVALLAQRKWFAR